MAKSNEAKEMKFAAEIERRTLQTLLNLADEFYRDPANRKAFEEWSKTPEGKACAARCR